MSLLGAPLSWSSRDMAVGGPAAPSASLWQPMALWKELLGGGNNGGKAGDGCGLLEAGSVSEGTFVGSGRRAVPV